MFPKSTELPNRFIAKEKFYANGDFNGKLKEAMTSDIAKITAINKLSSSTLNIKPGEIFPEIMVLKVVLKNKIFNIQLLDAMDKSIRAAYVLFILEFDNKCCASIAYKDKGKDSLNIVKRWTGPWVDELVFDLSGRTIDFVYENLLNQVSDGKIDKNAGKTLKERILKCIEIEKITKKIEQLENKMNNEPQLKKKLEIKSMIKSLKEGL